MYEVFLSGDRIYLRKVEESDFNRSMEWLNDQETTKWMQNGMYPKTEYDMITYRDSMQKPNLYLAIMVKNQLYGDEYIGNISVKNNTQSGFYSELSIVIGEEAYRGKGYATDAIKMVADHCFKRLDIHKLRAGACAENRGCIKAFTKAEFWIEGTESEAVYCDGHWRDIVVMGLLKSEWEKSNG